MDYDFAKNNFIRYVKQFDLKNQNILLKYRHTFYVVSWMEKLANQLHLSEEDKATAKIIGLLHDIGRFGQIKETNSFEDKILNHAILGCQYLFLEHHIRDFTQEENKDHLIEFAIRNHNKLEIDKSLDEKEIQFAKMIRDMDKLDIFRVEAVELENEFIKEDITPACLREWEEHKPINRKKIQTKTDLTLSYLSFLYDINFPESYELLKKSRHLELFIQSLKIAKESEKNAQEIFQEAKEYIRKKVK